MKKINLVLCLLLVIFLAACGNSTSNTQEESNSSNAPNTSDLSEQEKYVLKLAHAYPTASYMHTFMEWFNEEVQKRSDGRLSLDIYPSGQLMPTDQEVPAILQGQIDMSHSLSPVLAGFDPIWNLYELPFIFEYDPKDPTVFIENRAKFNNSENGGRKIAQLMEEKGLKVLSLGFVDMFGSLYTTDKNNLVTDPESAKGLKIRTAGGIIGPETVKSFGASGMTIPAAELVTALQQKVVDGLLTTPIYTNDAKLPVETLTVVPLFNTVTPLVMSLEKFESLPEDLQEILVQTGKDLEEYGKAQVIEKAKTAYTTLADEGVEIYYPTEEEINEWREATKPAREVFENQVEGGKELLEELSNLN
ncbi:TRAP transporter substrate-binding protein [Alkalihalobacillus sp. BA299]|uniref:TRAP transporter substrate-binding protein n=1 Tax=Alkalihalobacillus sp. BA299 TaxID=2815938 RepID=UPI001ADB9096|nr:TRAP transporter substrate-binding protein [Alkalihalobacillus sp. BA299]